jgi:hypothetical protein
MNVAHVSHSMGEHERLIFFATNRHGFFVQRQGRIATIHVSFNLAHTFERSDQLASRAGLAAKPHCCGVVAMGVVGSILKPGAIRFNHQFHCSLCTPVHLTPVRLLCQRNNLDILATFTIRLTSRRIKRNLQ